MYYNNIIPLNIIPRWIFSEILISPSFFFSYWYHTGESPLGNAQGWDSNEEPQGLFRQIQKAQRKFWGNRNPRKHILGDDALFLDGGGSCCPLSSQPHDATRTFAPLWSQPSFSRISNKFSSAGSSHPTWFPRCGLRSGVNSLVACARTHTLLCTETLGMQVGRRVSW